MKSLKENWILVLLIAVLVGVVGHVMIYSFFNKQVTIRAFEECLTTIVSEGNWVTRKDTVKYCIEETR